MTFRLGDPKPATSGRKPGVENKRTIEVRGILMAAVHEIGGMERLVAWIKEEPQNEFAFWTQMFPRLLPVRVEGSGAPGEIELSAEIKPEDLSRRLEERGLPTAVFGIDKPVLELQANKGNGSEPSNLSTVDKSSNGGDEPTHNVSSLPENGGDE